MLANDMESRQQLLRMIAILLLALIATLGEDALADGHASLKLTPERCIAMNEGQTCYQKITVTWTAEEAADICLFNREQSAPIMCWSAASEGRTRIEFGSDQSVTYQLVLASDQNNQLAEATLSVSWVYSEGKKRRNSWRLF